MKQIISNGSKKHSMHRNFSPHSQHGWMMMWWFFMKNMLFILHKCNMTLSSRGFEKIEWLWWSQPTTLRTKDILSWFLSWWSLWRKKANENLQQAWGWSLGRPGGALHRLVGGKFYHNSRSRLSLIGVHYHINIHILGYIHTYIHHPILNTFSKGASCFHLHCPLLSEERDEEIWEEAFKTW